MPPTAILRGSDAGWTPVDRVLAVAEVLARDMRCGGCGQPKHEAWNPDSEGWYEERQAGCQGCAALARGADGQREPRPEVKRWVVDVRPPDVELAPWTPGAEPIVGGGAGG